MATNLAFPYGINPLGRTATAEWPRHVRDMIELLLFTHPGERVNRPEFGSGVLQLVFAPNSPELAAALQFTVQAALGRYLGDVADFERVEIQAQDATLHILVAYRLKPDGLPVTETFSWVGADGPEDRP